MYIFLINPMTMENLDTRSTMKTAPTLPFFPILAIVMNILIVNSFPRFTSFLQSSSFLNKLKIRVENCLGFSCEPEKSVSVDTRVLDGRDHGSGMSRRDVEMVTKSLGLYSSGGEELGEFFGRGEFARVFDDEEPSLGEVKEAFDVFDENGDGFIDGKELQRVLYLLGFKQGSDIEHCHRMIMNVDSNGDGKIDFHEFVKFMETIFC